MPPPASLEREWRCSLAVFSREAFAQLFVGNLIFDPIRPPNQKKQIYPKLAKLSNRSSIGLRPRDPNWLRLRLKAGVSDYYQ